MFISPHFLGFIIRNLHFFIMDSKINHATCMGVAVIVIAAGVAIIEREEVEFIYQENHV